MFSTRTALAAVVLAVCACLSPSGAATAGTPSPTADDNCAGIGVHVGLCQVLAEHHVLSGNNQQLGSRP
ncbi:hypothetical protein [Streptomyces sp. NBC_00083]|uniref:hypothetical protein n=1 Tax=Streptomyces sp. NBC_00083 TaxID=2975647 RepID=UPI0022589938|nr:hypothetical protein [Streptomyces sp. NBC_00083]MCX5384323.1 hypothetical protein [Streptomyces sp. NBC_00083]